MKQKKRFIKELNREIEKLHIDLQKTFKAYANPNRNAYNQNIYLRVDFDDTIYKRNKLHKLFFVIESLRKLDFIVYVTQSINKKTGKIKAPKIIRPFTFKKYENFNPRFDMTKKEIEEINKKNKDFTKLHWSEEVKIKYEIIHQIGNMIISSNHKDFYNLLYSLLENKEQTEKYTRLIFGKSIKHKTKAELAKK